MTALPDPTRPVPPTAAEIAALTARLRDISARGRAVDPAERAQVLADKDDLIARITASTDEPGVTDPGRDGPPMPDWMRRQARETEAAMAAGTAPAPPSDDAAVIAQRLAELRAAQGESGGPTVQRQAPQVVGDVDAVRREQLARWHAEDELTDTGTEPTLVRGEDR